MLNSSITSFLLFSTAITPCAFSKSDNTILKLYSENNISTIDNINEGIGKVSLTNLLKNQNVVGHYGTSDVSTEIIAYEK